jgi:hypothetical protein
METIDVYVGEPSPQQLGDEIMMAGFDIEPRSPSARSPQERLLADAHPLSLDDFNWPSGIRPVWPGIDTSRCVAAVNPRQGEALDRFLVGAEQRKETALLLIELGEPRLGTRRPRLYRGEEAADDFPAHLASVDWRRLPSGVSANLVDGLDGPERDLALRLRDRHGPDETWFAVDPPSAAPRPDNFAPILGDFSELLIDDANEPTAGLWVPRDADARCYLFSYGCDWDLILRWLLDQAVPAYVPSAALRARVGEVADELLTSEERGIQVELADLEAEYGARRVDLDARRAVADARAQPIRNGLLYGRGDPLKGAVKEVLRDCGFEIEDLDYTFRRPASADLLATLKGRHWLVEVRYAGGAPGHAQVDDVRRHIRNWKSLGREEELEGGVFVVNHHGNDPPMERPPAPYQDRYFVAALECSVIGTPALYRWWANGDFDEIVSAVTGPPRQHERPE